MVGKRIKTLRMQRNMSLRALAERIPLSISFLSDIENGRGNPSINRLEEIASALDTTTAYLIEGEPISLDNFPTTIQQSELFAEVLMHLRSFEVWSSADREELLMYLRAKKNIRQENG
jgi:transcriptional regulator with XRE-family HTH domain